MAELSKFKRDKEEASARMEDALEEAKVAAFARDEWESKCAEAGAKAQEQLRTAAREREELEQKLKAERGPRDAEVKRRLGVARTKLQAEMDAKP